MRKRLKKKRHSCGLCKPHKMGGSVRWTNRDLASLKEFEKIEDEVWTALVKERDVPGAKYVSHEDAWQMVD